MLDARRIKLKFRAGHRGFREMDMFMEAFVAAHLDTMSEADLEAFEGVLDIPDQDVYAWITGQAQPPPEMRSGALDLLLAFRYPRSLAKSLARPIRRN